MSQYRNLHRLFNNLQTDLYIHRYNIVFGGLALYLLPQIPKALRFRSKYMVPINEERYKLIENGMITIVHF